MNDINYTRSKKRSQQKINRPENMAFTVFCWIFMIGSWLLLITPFFIWLPYGDNSIIKQKVAYKAIIAFIIGAGCYLIHFILQLCSLCSTFFCFHIQESFQKIMVSFFKDRPTYTLSLGCYHYESEVREYVDEDGYTQRDTYSYKVYSFTGEKNIEYYSCRDISGLLEIEDAENIEYIMLKTDYDITFYNDNSRSDFEKEKKDFKKSHKDDHVEFDKIITFNSLKRNEIYIFKLNNNKNSCSINGCFFFILILIPFVEFYKIYINSKFIFKHFTFRKVISMRTNLNNIREPDIYNPQIIVNNQLYDISPYEYIYANHSFSSPNMEVNERINERRNESINEGRNKEIKEGINEEKNKGINEEGNEGRNEEINERRNEKKNKGINKESLKMSNNINATPPIGIDLKIKEPDNEFNNMLNSQPINVQVRQKNHNINENIKNNNINNEFINENNLNDEYNNEINIENNEINNENNEIIQNINENDSNNPNTNRIKLLNEDEKCSNFSYVI